MEDKVECAICLETYNITDHVTRLMCGHKFCSRCILRYMWTHGLDTQCPMCRASVFGERVFALDDVSPTTHTTTQSRVDTLQQGDNNIDAAVERKREKRRLERMRKRQRKRRERGGIP